MATSGCTLRRTVKSSSVTYKDSVFTSYFYRTTGWIAGDGAFSINLGNDKSLWLFGDSYVDQFDTVTQTVPCLFSARNSAFEMNISNPEVLNTLKGNNSHTLFQVGSNNNYWFWPGMGFANNDTAYVFQSRLRNTGKGGMWGFEAVDSLFVAKIHIPTMELSGYDFLGTKNDISFNNGVVSDDGFHYIYGIKNNGFGNDLIVARFSDANPRSKWEYYNGSAWTTNILDAQKIFAEFTSSFYVFKLKNKYVLITTEFSVGCDQGKEIYTYVSETPYGPFTNKTTVWTVDDLKNGHYPFFYIAAAHPEYDNGKNELLITYSINGYGDCVETCIDGRLDPNVYRPKAIRVPFKLIDKSF